MPVGLQAAQVSTLGVDTHSRAALDSLGLGYTQEVLSLHL
jgi:hypothetical protein